MLKRILMAMVTIICLSFVYQPVCAEVDGKTYRLTNGCEATFFRTPVGPGENGVVEYVCGDTIQTYEYYRMGNSGCIGISQGAMGIMYLYEIGDDLIPLSGPALISY